MTESDFDKLQDKALAALRDILGDGIAYVLSMSYPDHAGGTFYIATGGNQSKDVSVQILKDHIHVMEHAEGNNYDVKIKALTKD
jgi:hypothetical protein